MRSISILFICYSTLLLSACSIRPSTRSSEITVAFYNVENLFDTKDDPNTEDADFLPEGKLGWNAERYQAKLNMLSQVIDSLGGASTGPDILGVCEIENLAVLQDLVSSPVLVEAGYQIVHEDSPDARGIDVGLLYKANAFTPIVHKLYKVALAEEPEFRTRGILLVKGLIGKQDTLTIMVNHWPSKRGGDEASRYRRIAAAKVLSQVRDSLLAKNPHAKILAMGDFNDEPHSVPIHEVLPAYATPDSMTILQSFYNPLAMVKQNGQGSYRYRDQWNMLDQFLLSKGLLTSSNGYHYGTGSAQVFNAYWLQQHGDKYEGYPNRTYAGSNYLGGYSDHFAIRLKLIR